MHRLLLLFFLLIFSKTTLAQDKFICTTYYAKSVEKIAENMLSQEINHTLTINADKSFIYKKEHASNSCNFNFVGNWSCNDEELTLHFMEEFPTSFMTFEILENKSLGQIFLKQDHLLLYAKNQEISFPDNKKELKRNKKIFKDTPCPKF
jgi:hypothetical protein